MPNHKPYKNFDLEKIHSVVKQSNDFAKRYYRKMYIVIPRLTSDTANEFFG